MIERLISRAHEDLRWLYGQAEADACGLKAVTWNVLEEVDRSRASSSTMSPGASRGAPIMVDPHPDERSRARARLRLAHAALCRVPHHHQAVLEAYFTPASSYPGRASSTLGAEWSPVACLLPDVQRAARRSRRERLVEVRLMVARDGTDVVRARCQEVLHEAVVSYARARFPGIAVAERASRIEGRGLPS